MVYGVQGMAVANTLTYNPTITKLLHYTGTMCLPSLHHSTKTLLFVATGTDDLKAYINQKTLGNIYSTSKSSGRLVLQFANLCRKC